MKPMNKSLSELESEHEKAIYNTKVMVKRLEMKTKSQVSLHSEKDVNKNLQDEILTREQIKTLIDLYHKESPVWAWDLADKINDFISSAITRAYEEGKRDGKSIASWQTELKRVVEETRSESNKFWKKKVQEAVTVTVDEEHKKLRVGVGMLRQWINEDRITDKKLVTNEEIETMLGISQAKTNLEVIKEE